MPINAYTGLMGSGKTYEVVSTVIIKAVRDGRRVVTNISGIDSDNIRAFCVERFNENVERLGAVVTVSNEDVAQRDFLPHVDGDYAGVFVQPGDVVVIDEAWRVWGADCKIGAEHRIFFREHRHYAHPQTGVVCDLVVIVQDIGDLHRILKSVVEVSFRTHKIKSLGLNKTYRIEMWEGWKQYASKRVAVEVKRYDPAIFPLYQSYSGGAGVEVTVDDRQNILKSWKTWVYVVGTLAFLGYGFSSAYAMFFGGGSAKADSSSSKGQALAVPLTGGRHKPGKADLKPVSQGWRVAGSVVSGGASWLVLVSAEGAMRLESPSVASGSGLATVATIDGERVFTWSGVAARSSGGLLGEVSP